MSADIRRVERARLAAEPSHLEALVKFAERAYRRPLSAAERDDLLAFYHKLREQDDLGHEEALRDTLVSVLMSPHFCYRFDLAEPGDDGAAAVGLRAGQPAELFPLVEHARCRIAGPRRGRRPAPSRRC